MAEHDRPVDPNKMQLAILAASKHHVRSFADLGACWGVNAGYSIGLLDSFPIDLGFVVDQTVTSLSRERGKKFPQLQFVTGLLGDTDVISNIPSLDALLMYDILLHQVAPNWDDFLTRWSKKARVLVIYNQMWAQTEKTIRFIERGVEWYKKNVYHTNSQTIDEWFRTLDETDPATRRKRRNLHQFWQFGITTNDLTNHLQKLGYRLDFFKSYGPFVPTYPWIQNEGFIFVR